MHTSRYLRFLFTSCIRVIQLNSHFTIRTSLFHCNCSRYWVSCDDHALPFQVESVMTIALCIQWVCELTERRPDREAARQRGATVNSRKLITTQKPINDEKVFILFRWMSVHIQYSMNFINIVLNLKVCEFYTSTVEQSVYFLCHPYVIVCITISGLTEKYDSTHQSSKHLISDIYINPYIFLNHYPT